MEVLRLVLFRHTMKMRQFAILDLERAINELHGPPKVAMGRRIDLLRDDLQWYEGRLVEILAENPASDSDDSEFEN